MSGSRVDEDGVPIDGRPVLKQQPRRKSVGNKKARPPPQQPNVSGNLREVEKESERDGGGEGREGAN